MALCIQILASQAYQCWARRQIMLSFEVAQKQQRVSGTEVGRGLAAREIPLRSSWIDDGGEGVGRMR